MTPNPAPFDGYIEQPVRVLATALVHYQRSRYSVPADYAHRDISLRASPWEIALVAEGVEVARYRRCFERHQTVYDWQYYITVVERKPGALRNGPPFREMPKPLQLLQRHLLRYDGGDRVIARVLSAVAAQGLEPVAVELALASGKISGEHVLNVLARLQEAAPPEPILTSSHLDQEPKANVQHYDHLREKRNEELCHA